MSHTFLYKKLDEYGKGHNEEIIKVVTAEGERLSHLHQNPNENAPTGNFVSHVPDKGRKMVFDNFYFRQDVHHMRETHQNVDKHWVSHMCTENRISGNHLDIKKPPRTKLLEIDNGKFVPSRIDQQHQRENYAELVARIIVNKIMCLHFLKTYVSKTHQTQVFCRGHAANQHSKFSNVMYSNIKCLRCTHYLSSFFV